MPKPSFLPIVLAFVACGGSNNNNGPDAATHADASHVDSNHPVDALQTETETGRIFEDGDPLQTAIANAMVCFDGPTLVCATTDGSGDYTLDATGLPGVLDFAVRATADGHLETQVLGNGAVNNGLGITQWPSGIAVFDDARASELFLEAEFTYPPVGSGLVRAFVSGADGHALAGAVVAIANESNAPVYCDGSGSPDFALSATSSSGEVLFGNLAPGTYGVVVSATGKTCASDQFGWAGSGSAAALVPVNAATLTDDVGVICQ